MNPEENPRLTVSDLEMTVTAGGKKLPILRGASFTVGAGEMFGVIGESGAGKSTLLRALIGATGSRGSVELSGFVDFAGRRPLEMSPAELRHFLRSDIGFVYQNPKRSLNPVKTIGSQLAETLALREGLKGKEAELRSIELLELVRLGAATTRLRQYPSELSGGMLQRVAIALALTGRPKFLLADEPTSALDVTVAYEIHKLLDELKTTLMMGCVLVSHSVTLMSQWADRIGVMYAGRVIESGTASSVFSTAQHPYTAALLSARPTMSLEPGTDLVTIPGSAPSPREHVGCAFASRCSKAIGICETTDPWIVKSLTPNGDSVDVACHLVPAINAERIPVS